VTTVRLVGAVLLILLIGCSKPNSRIQTRLNRDAEISGELPYNPLLWDVISSSLNAADHTVRTISGNENAVDYARHHASRRCVSRDNHFAPLVHTHSFMHHEQRS
jgi:hypothetical protein